jgi:hypothetical protein
MDEGTIVAIIGGMFTFFGLILRTIHNRQQKELEQLRAKSELDKANAEAEAKEREQELRIRVTQVNDNAEILKRMITIMEARDERNSASIIRSQDAQTLQLDAMREMTDSMKLQTQRLTEVDTIARSIKTDLGLTNETLHSLPNWLGNQFNPVVINLSAIMVKIESFLTRAADWDERIGLFAAGSNERFDSVKETIDGVRLEIRQIREYIRLPASPPQLPEREEESIVNPSQEKDITP